MADVSKFLDKAYEGKEFSELANAPVEALQGLSKADAEALQEALGLRTIRRFAGHTSVRAARAITPLAGAK